jgi:hypothetical protein
MNDLVSAPWLRKGIVWFVEALPLLIYPLGKYAVLQALSLQLHAA